MKIKNRFFFLTLLASFFVSYGESILRASADEFSDDLIHKEESSQPNFILVPPGELSDQSSQIDLQEAFDNFVTVSTNFKKDLQYHKANAILIRDNVERANKNFSLADRKRVFDIDFESLKLFLEENSSDRSVYEESIFSFIRVIQIISEDQLTFYTKYFEVMSKLKSIAATEPTCRLVEGQYTFAHSYNILLRDVFQFFLRRFPTAPVFEEIDIKPVLSDLARIPKILGSLSQKYNIKLSLLAVPLRLEEIGEIHSANKISPRTKSARRASEPRIRWSEEDHPKDRIVTAETELGGLYGYNWDKIECERKRSSKKKKSSEVSSKDKRKKTTKKDKKKKGRVVRSLEKFREQLSPRKVKFDEQNVSIPPFITSDVDSKETRNT